MAFAARPPQKPLGPLAGVMTLLLLGAGCASTLRALPAPSAAPASSAPRPRFLPSPVAPPPFRVWDRHPITLEPLQREVLHQLQASPAAWAWAGTGTFWVSVQVFARDGEARPRHLTLVVEILEGDSGRQRWLGHGDVLNAEGGANPEAPERFAAQVQALLATLPRRP